MKNERIGTLDFETDPFLAGRIPFPFACGIYFSDDRYSIIWDDKNCAEKTASLLRKLPTCTIYAHNGGKFDFFYLVEFADAGRIMVRNGRIFEMQIGRVLLRDSWPLMPFALEEYRKTKIDYRIFERERRNETQNKLKIQHYLFDDCKNLYELVTGFRAILGPKDTIGSAAFYQMRKCGIEIPSLNESHDEIFRPYFYGGRVQAFKRGIFHERLSYFDVNSAYPFAMLHNHPSGSDYRHSKLLPRNPDRLGISFLLVEATSQGAFPFRAIDGSLDFPCERGIFHVTGWEYIAALETNTARIHKILEVWTPHNTINFSDFVLPFYEKRMQAKRDNNLIGYLAYKYLLNSGYGKFAQNPRDFREYCIQPFGAMPNEQSWEWETDYCAISLWSRSSYDGWGFYDVTTGASITGHQRALLWRGIQNSKRVLYCDTDAIICGASTVPVGADLGVWKIEGRINECCIAGKKLYGLRGKTTEGEPWEKISSKGARLSYSEIKSLCSGKIVEWKNPAPTFSATLGAHFLQRNIKSTGD